LLTPFQLIGLPDDPWRYIFSEFRMVRWDGKRQLIKTIAYLRPDP
jgi:hypothetical protein